MLAAALKKRGVELELEHWDGHKHVDIYIPKDHLYIEVDGVPHYRWRYFTKRIATVAKNAPNRLGERVLNS